VSQIVAGGVGLNNQAASVVVICEPQLEPTTEWEAIARARRMGQLQTVQVHRLLSEEGVDPRITEILAKKKALFEEFARVSDRCQRPRGLRQFRGRTGP
jgi:SNF2 family DNA or RNA helicase